MPLSRLVLALSLLPSLATAQQVQVVHAFETALGRLTGALAEAPDGSLFGVTGTEIFRRTPSGAVDIVHRFEGEDTPSGLTPGGDGLLYGLTRNSVRKRDTVFRLDPGSLSVRTIHVLAPASEGAEVSGNLARSGAFLYGLTAGAPEGIDGWTIFRVSPSTGAFDTIFVYRRSEPSSLLQSGSMLVATNDGFLMGFCKIPPFPNRAYRFDPVTRTLVDFPIPPATSGIVSSSDGFVYGWALHNGLSGTIYRIEPASGTVTPVHTLPTGVFHELAQGPDGDLYGVSSTSGGVFRLAASVGGGRTYEPLPFIFFSPRGLTSASDQRIYGHSNDLSHLGELFRFDPAGTGPPGNPFDYTVLHVPSSTVPYTVPSQPVQAADGLLYGTARFGGPGDKGGRGAAYRLDPATGVVTMLANIPGPGYRDDPAFDLVEGPDGRLYSTTVTTEGVTRRFGILRLDPVSGSVTVAADFVDPDGLGVSTFAGLTRTPSGAIYGTLRRWSRADAFRFDPQANTIVTVATLPFTDIVGQVTRLTPGGDGLLYGAYLTRTGSFVFDARVFRVNEGTGTLDTIANLGAEGTLSNLVAGVDGALYLVAGLRLVSFTPATGAVRDVCRLDAGGTVLGLTRGADDAFYGFMGPAPTQWLFRCDPATGVLTRLQRLNGSEGVQGGALAVASDGFFYSATTGGRSRGGAILRIALSGVPPMVDTDGDGLPNTWETSYGLNAASAIADGGGNGDADGDGESNAAELMAGTHPRGTSVRHFAEGATGTFFRTRLSLLNPGPYPANVLLRFLTDAGTTVPHHLILPAMTMQAIDVGSLTGLASANFSTVIEADAYVSVDRTMTWDATGYGSHSETAAAVPAPGWFFAEGSTSGDFALFYLLQNPQDTAVTATITYLRPAGQAPVVRSYTLPPLSRTTIQVDGQPGLESTDVSASIAATGAIIAERALYLSKPGQPFSAGHASVGVTAAALEWFLAEGATGPFFDTFVLIANPNPTAAQVTVEYLLIGGGVLAKNYTVAPTSRFTIWVDDEQIPAGSGQKPLTNVAVSTTVRSTNNVPVVVERAMWWPGPEVTANYWHEAHNSPGATATASRWSLADGEVGGAAGAETYVLVANPAAAVVRARVTLVFEDTATLSKDYDLAPKSRTNVPISAAFPGVVNRRFGVIVESVGGPAPLAVERATYASPGGVTWASGTGALAAPVP